jgi:large subunit ribosomal protein L30e
MSSKSSALRDTTTRRKKKKEFDVKKNINIAVKSGNVVIGSNKILKAMRQERFKMIILAENCPVNIKKKIINNNSLLDDPIFIHTFNQSSWELGLACGKPFMVASLGIFDEGDSDILALIK